MVQPTQFLLSHKEVLALMVKSSGVTEGRWALVANFGFAPGNFGPTEESMNPGTVVVLTGLGIQKETSESGKAPSGLVVDAAEVNPPSNLPSAPEQKPRREPRRKML